jgi:hypothetical protein
MERNSPETNTKQRTRTILLKDKDNELLAEVYIKYENSHWTIGEIEITKPNIREEIRAILDSAFTQRLWLRHYQTVRSLLGEQYLIFGEFCSVSDSLFPQALVDLLCESRLGNGTRIFALLQRYR